MTVEDPHPTPPRSRSSAFLSGVDEQVEAERQDTTFPDASLRDIRRATERAARGSAGRSLDPELQLVAVAAEVDVAVPTASNVPGVAPVKRVLRKGMSWYLQYLAQQVAALGGAVLRLGRATARELGRLDADVTELRERLDQLEGGPPPPTEPDRP